VSTRVKNRTIVPGTQHIFATTTSSVPKMLKLDLFVLETEICVHKGKKPYNCTWYTTYVFATTISSVPKLLKLDLFILEIYGLEKAKKACVFQLEHYCSSI
jgi:hypothetical protein